jgi:hypothetical protein
MQTAEFKDELFLPGELAIAERIPHRCPCCFGILVAPLASICGHVVCTECVVKLYGGAWADAAECRMCHGKKPGWHRAVTVEFQLKNLKVKCGLHQFRCPPGANAEHRQTRDATKYAAQLKAGPECPWTGNLSDRTEHIAKKCPYAFVGCPYDCGLKVARESEDIHLEWCLFQREIDCKLCGETCTGYDDLANGHHRICPEMNVGCAYCEKITLRKEHPAHVAVCEEAPITCDKCGTYPFKRKDMRNHLVVNCPAVRIQCTCGQRITRAQMEEHKKDPAAAVLHLKALEEENLNLKRQLEKTQYAAWRWDQSEEKRKKPWKPSEVKAKAKAMEVDSESDEEEGERKCIRCGKMIYRRMSHTAKNPGRLFWTHNSAAQEGCSMFMWDDGRP